MDLNAADDTILEADLHQPVTSETRPCGVLRAPVFDTATPAVSWGHGLVKVVTGQ